MPLVVGRKQNFETLQAACLARDAALLECELAASGDQVAVVICAVNREPDGAFQFVPLAMLFNDNPFQTVNPPRADGPGFSSQEIPGDG